MKEPVKMPVKEREVPGLDAVSANEMLPADFKGFPVTMYSRKPIDDSGAWANHSLNEFREGEMVGVYTLVAIREVLVERRLV